MKKRIQLQTKTYDLDWNRHITSRTYERFGYEGRWAYLADIGYPIQEIIHSRSLILPVSTKVRFLAQQYAGSTLSIDTEIYQLENGILLCDQKILDKEEKPVCDLKTSFFLLDSSRNAMRIPESRVDISENDLESLNQLKEDLEPELNPIPSTVEPIVHELQIHFSDMDPFWTLPNESIWKYFEEGRFLFFREIAGFDSVQTADTTSFFMGGEIKIYKLPEPGTKVQILSWIDSIEKVRFFFRQDLVDIQGTILVKMRDEQVFVKLPKARPCRVPESFLTATKKLVAVAK